MGSLEKVSMISIVNGVSNNQPILVIMRHMATHYIPLIMNFFMLLVKLSNPFFTISSLIEFSLQSSIIW